MPKLSPVIALDKILSNLIKQYREHREALTKIETVFSKYGIDPQNGRSVAPAARPPTDEPAAPARGRRRRRRRGSFDQTAEEFVLGMISGSKSPTTAQINAEWVKSGRANKADNTLTKLVKERKLKREAVKDGRGSKYNLA
jgi:hypothetical protein